MKHPAYPSIAGFTLFAELVDDHNRLSTGLFCFVHQHEVMYFVIEDRLKTENHEFVRFG